MIELTVKVSNEEKRMTKKHLVHENDLVLSRDDPLLISLVNEATQEFASEVDDVKLIITMIW